MLYMLGSSVDINIHVFSALFLEMGLTLLVWCSESLDSFVKICKKIIAHILIEIPTGGWYTSHGDSASYPGSG